MKMQIKMQVLDHGYVELIETWGSDERIIEAARMSTQKGFQGWGDTEKPGDEKLLAYLWKNKHSTPFEFAGMVIEVQAPIFVFREWHRHRTQSYNEMSARYSPLPEVYYIPSKERLKFGGQSTVNKQASGNELSDDAVDNALVAIECRSVIAFESYREMLKAGVAKELARLVLPVNTYSRMRATANLHNWLHFLTLRTAENAQWEIRQFANAVSVLVADSFPRTYSLWAADNA